MASLKEVRTRIATVNNTRKITSAMKLVASSKLHRAQQAIEHMRPFAKQLERITTNFVGSLDDNFTSPFAINREVKHVLIIAYSSNSSLCGAFNANVIKRLKEVVEQYRQQDSTTISVLPIGRKVAEAAAKLNVTVEEARSALLDHPSYKEVSEVAAEVMRRFLNKEVDKVELIHNHFNSPSSQTLLHDTYLPIELHKSEEATVMPDYIIEPSVEELMTDLIPQGLHLKLYTALLDSLASEHASRVIAMQVATDNADKMLQELTLMYNKTRQQAITTELLDIVGGSMR